MAETGVLHIVILSNEFAPINNNKDTSIKKFKYLDSFAKIRCAFSLITQIANSPITDALDKLMSHRFLFAKQSSIFCALQFNAFFFYHI